MSNVRGSRLLHSSANTSPFIGPPIKPIPITAKQDKNNQAKLVIRNEFKISNLASDFKSNLATVISRLEASGEGASGNKIGVTESMLQRELDLGVRLQLRMSLPKGSSSSRNGCGFREARWSASRPNSSSSRRSSSDSNWKKGRKKSERVTKKANITLFFTFLVFLLEEESTGFVEGTRLQG
ncbi:hypothetical protein SLEP1_g2525 [Rubroshorea leprosula]|uniref:Uncharacterized protein n=1 Tax=Rubroshorea leprosula TaxID=152421 RepID=A0AAV5HSU9_9ROSI|nr:hypothetical protein SLEP1_g2525 [Rubroshorea leprosula]